MKEIIAGRRKELGLTQQQLAEMLHISDKVISKWETGRSLPDTSMLLPLANALQLSVNDLLKADEASQISVRQTFTQETKEKYKNLYLVAMALQLIAAVFITAGRLLLDRSYHSEGLAVLGYLLIVFAVVLEISAIAFYLAKRNSLLNHYPESIALDKKYINVTLLSTYLLFFIVITVFVALHGLSLTEQLITLILSSLIVLIPFAVCFIWNRKRKS